VDEGRERDSVSTASLFEFNFEQRLQCSVTGQVRYSLPNRQTLANTWDLRIPLDRAVNLVQVDELRTLKKQRINEEMKDSSDDLRLVVPFEAVVETHFIEEVVSYTNPAVGAAAPTTRSIRFQSFPKYLMVKLGRYYVDENWKQVKVDARVPMPETLDLTSYRGHGLQPNEQTMPETTSSDQTASDATINESNVVADESVMAQLTSMGFSENASRKAAIANDNNIETAINWVFAHMDDADFNDPPVNNDRTLSTPSHPAKSDVNLEHVAMLSAMGYSDSQASAALIATGHDIERAADWLFSHADSAFLDAAANEVLSYDDVLN